jgi:hypothetical protein
MCPPHCYWQGSFKNFVFGLIDPLLLLSSWSGGRGDMNRHVPRGGANGNGKRLGALVLLLAKRRLGGLSPGMTVSSELRKSVTAINKIKN